jgi:hypothetical protein
MTVRCGGMAAARELLNNPLCFYKPILELPHQLQRCRRHRFFPPLSPDSSATTITDLTCCCLQLCAGEGTRHTGGGPGVRQSGGGSELRPLVKNSSRWGMDTELDSERVILERLLDLIFTSILFFLTTNFFYKHSWSWSY